MIVLGSYMLSLKTYLTIGMIISLVLILYFIWKDMVGDYGLDILSLIRDISEGLCIGIGWIFTIPILAVTNLILVIINSFFEDEEE